MRFAISKFYEGIAPELSGPGPGKNSKLPTVWEHHLSDKKKQSSYDPAIEENRNFKGEVSEPPKKKSQLVKY